MSKCLLYLSVPLIIYCVTWSVAMAHLYSAGVSYTKCGPDNFGPRDLRTRESYPAKSSPVCNFLIFCDHDCVFSLAKF